MTVMVSKCSMEFSNTNSQLQYQPGHSIEALPIEVLYVTPSQGLVILGDNSLAFLQCANESQSPAFSHSLSLSFATTPVVAAITVVWLTPSLATTAPTAHHHVHEVHHAWHRQKRLTELVHGCCVRVSYEGEQSVTQPVVYTRSFVGHAKHGAVWVLVRANAVACDPRGSCIFSGLDDISRYACGLMFDMLR